MLDRHSKIIVIIHLCFAFTYASYILFKPILDNWFSQKGTLGLIESVVSEKELYHPLSPEIKLQITLAKNEIMHGEKKSYLSSLSHLICKESKALCLGWFFFSILICLALLFSIEGAYVTTLILPLIVLGYGITLFFSAPPKLPETLFPSEEEVLENYSPVPYAKGFGHKKESLQKAWAHYLILCFAKEDPAEEPDTYKEQLKKGIFNFNLERLKRVLEKKETISSSSYFRNTPSFLLWLFYFCWNSFFAIFLLFKRQRYYAQAPI